METKNVGSIQQLWDSWERKVNNTTSQPDTGSPRLLFRGQLTKFELAPGILRRHEPLSTLIDVEQAMCQGILSQPQFQDDIKEKKRIPALCIMQHFGLVTRLLDWTESWMIAMQFALGMHKDDSLAEPFSVWTVDRIAVYQAMQQLGQVPTLNENFARDSDFVQVERGPHLWLFSACQHVTFERLRAQKGWFSISKTFEPHDDLLMKMGRQTGSQIVNEYRFPATACDYFRTKISSLLDTRKLFADADSAKETAAKELRSRQTLMFAQRQIPPKKWNSDNDGKTGYTGQPR